MRTRSESAIAIGLATLLAVSVVASVGLAGAGSVVAQEDTGFEVDVEFVDDPLLATDGQTVAVEVTNTADDDLTSPLIEIPLRGSIAAGEEFDSTDGDNPTLDAATVTYEDGSSEDESAYTDDSTFRSGQAIFVTAEEVAAGDTNTYEVDVTITSDGERSLETDVRPLNREDNNVRAETSEEAKPVGDLEIDADSDQQVTIDGDVEGDGDRILENIEATEYDVSAEMSLLGDNLTVEDLSVPADGAGTVTFFDPTSATDPTVLARTGSEADVIGLNTPLRVGNAETPFTKEFDFLLGSEGGETYMAVEDPGDLHQPQGTELDASSGSITEIDTPGTDETTLVEIDVNEDTEILIEYLGYELGNVNLDDEVNEADATTIAEHLASSTENQVNMYGDVNQDDEISAVDSMLIQQYVDGNVDEDYEVID